jgi:Fe2+ transport system protein B
MKEVKYELERAQLVRLSSSIYCFATFAATVRRLSRAWTTFLMIRHLIVGYLLLLGVS